MSVPEVEVRGETNSGLYVNGRFRGMVRKGYKYDILPCDERTGTLIAIMTEDGEHVTGTFWILPGDV